QVLGVLDLQRLLRRTTLDGDSDSFQIDGLDRRGLLFFVGGNTQRPEQAQYTQADNDRTHEKFLHSERREKALPNSACGSNRSNPLFSTARGVASSSSQLDTTSKRSVIRSSRTTSAMAMRLVCTSSGGGPNRCRP